LIFVVTALAAPCERALTGEELAALEARSRRAVDDDDPGGHHRVMDEVALRVKCLDGPVPQGPWARLLVNETIVRYAEKRVWEPLLATALAVDPGVGNVPAFILDTFAQPTRPDAEPLPAGVALWVDGTLATHLPDPRGLHVVQTRDEALGSWTSALLRDADVPESFLAVDTPGLPEPEGWVAAYGTAGIGAWSQRVDAPGSFLSDGDEPLRTAGLGTYGHLAAVGPVGVAWDLGASYSSLEKRPLPTGSFVAGASFGRAWTLVVGAAATLSRAHTAEAASLHTSAEPHVGLRFRFGPVDAAVGGGGLPSSGHLLVRAGWSGSKDLSWRVGLGLDATRNHAVEQDGTGRRARLGWFGAHLAVGVRLRPAEDR
jgi:hypothetical protein